MEKRVIFLSAQQDTRLNWTPACLTERHLFVQETAKLFGGLTVGENGGVECGVVVVLHGDHGPEVPLHELRVVPPGHNLGGCVKRRCRWLVSTSSVVHSVMYHHIFWRHNDDKRLMYLVMCYEVVFFVEPPTSKDSHYPLFGQKNGGATLINEGFSPSLNYLT